MPLHLLIIPFLCGFITQLVKLLLRAIRERNFSWRWLDDYGGMPSAHAAFLSSLGATVALAEGLNSILFAVVFIIGAIMIRDALGLRMYIERQGKILRSLTQKIPGATKLVPKNLNLGERVGHTYPEAIVGFCFGVILAFALYQFF